MERKAELSVFGETRRLGDLVRVIRGLHSADDATQFVDNPGLLGVAVVDGGAILDGWIDHAAIRRYVLSWEGEELEAGDICLRSIRGRGKSYAGSRCDRKRSPARPLPIRDCSPADR